MPASRCFWPRGGSAGVGTGTSAEEVQAKLGKILQGADPPRSEEAMAELLQETGFAPPLKFFSSLFWGAWLTHRAALSL